jgi:hypothetical protein
MPVYPTYKTLVRSNLYDRFVFNFINNNGLTFYTVLFVLDQLVSILVITSFYFSSQLNSWFIRELITWSVIGISFYLQSWSWFIILLLIKFIRLLFEYGIPLLLHRIRQIRFSEDIETFSRRMYQDLLSSTLQTGLYQRCVHNLLGLIAEDKSEPFTEQELELISTVFTELENALFIIDNTNITIFLQSFMFRLDSSKIHFINTNSIKPKLSSDFCAICQSTSHYGVELKCNHRFCNECIFNWINNNHKDCPLCRVNFL